jgi:hypothetical protein
MQSAGTSLARFTVMAAVIETQRLTKIFRTEEIETHALAGIDLSIE